MQTQNTEKVKRGEIYLHDFGDNTGSIQNGVRPVLVVQCDEGNQTSTTIFFDVTEEHSTKESGVTLIKVNKENTAQKGTFTIEKTGEIFTGVSVIGGIDENENALPAIYQPIYEVQGLSDAVYEIIAAEDIITPDGTLRISKH